MTNKVLKTSVSLLKMSEANKITELIKHKGKFSYSFEVTPDVSEDELFSLKEDPVFFSVTWHAKQHQCKDLNIGPVRTASILRSKQKHVLLHLSCDMLKTDYLDELLTMLQERNICNLFLILGGELLIILLPICFFY